MKHATSGSEDRDKFLQRCLAPCHGAAAKSGGEDIADMRLSRSAVCCFGIGGKDMNAIKVLNR